MTDLYTDNGNFTSLIFRHGRDRASRKALVIPTAWDDHSVTDVHEVTYGEFIDRIQSLRAGFDAQGGR